MLVLTTLAAVAISTSARVLRRVDPITDAESAYVLIGDKDRHVAIGCLDTRQPEVRAVIKFGRYVGTAKPGVLAGGTELAYRFDNQPPQTVRWYSQGDTVRAEGERTLPMKFIQALKNTRSVYLRAFDFQGEAIDMAFSYGPIAGDIDSVLDRCGFNESGTRKK